MHPLACSVVPPQSLWLFIVTPPVLKAWRHFFLFYHFLYLLLYGFGRSLEHCSIKLCAQWEFWLMAFSSNSIKEEITSCCSFSSSSHWLICVILTTAGQAHEIHAHYSLGPIQILIIIFNIHCLHSSPVQYTV